MKFCTCPARLPARLRRVAQTSSHVALPRRGRPLPYAEPTSSSRHSRGSLPSVSPAVRSPGARSAAAFSPCVLSFTRQGHLRQPALPLVSLSPSPEFVRKPHAAAWRGEGNFNSQKPGPKPGLKWDGDAVSAPMMLMLPAAIGFIQKILHHQPLSFVLGNNCHHCPRVPFS